MRHPFYMDRLDSDDRKKVRRLLVQVLAFYLSLALLLVAGSVVKDSLDAQADPARRQPDVISR